MKVETVKKPKSVVEITISVSESDLNDYRKLAIQKLSKERPPKGFRPGKADEEILSRFLGKTAVEKAVFDAALPSLYIEAVKQAKLNPINKADADILSKDPLVIKFIVEVLPEVKLGDYKKIKIKTDTVKVGDKDIDAALVNLQKHFAGRRGVNRPAKKGDFMEIDFTGSIDGKEHDKLKSKNHPLELGSGILIPDFERQLIGLKGGDDKKISFKFPTNFSQKDLAGKKAEFRVKVNRVEELEPVSLDDEFAKKVSNGNLSTIAALRDAIKDDLQKHKDNQQVAQQENEVLNQLDKLAKVELPDSLTNDEVEHIFMSFSSNLESRGTSIGAYCVQQKTSPEKIKEGFRGEAEHRIRVRLALLQVAKEAKIEVDPKELEAALGNEKTDTRTRVIKETELTLKSTMKYLLKLGTGK